MSAWTLARIERIRVDRDAAKRRVVELEAEVARLKAAAPKQQELRRREAVGMERVA